MKKLLVPVLSIVILLLCAFWLYGMVSISRSVGVFATDVAALDDTYTDGTSDAAAYAFVKTENGQLYENIYDSSVRYEVYVNGKLTKSFYEYNDAVAYAENHKESSIKEKDKPKWLWDNFVPYNVFIGVEEYTGFQTFAEALYYAGTQPRSYIYYRKDNSLLWTNAEELPESVLISAPLINQMPELPRGCEVTSLAMLLNYKKINIDKMTLAEQIKKDDTPFQIIGGKKYRGNPNNGFIGSMYDMSKNGLGVYHRPIYELLAEYLPDSALDVTGCEFEDLYYFIANGEPVWVIITSTFKKLPESDFETWHTPDGEMKITYREHSVLITGYDEKYIYFNDPNSDELSKADKKGFIEAWEQMGRQAVTCTP